IDEPGVVLVRIIMMIFFIIYISLVFVSCNITDSQNEKMNESELKEAHLYDIYFIKKDPKTTEKQPLSKVIKLAFTQNDSSLGNTIAMDLENNTIYIDPWMSSMGINYKSESKPIDDIDEAVNILEKYNVQDWKEDYSYEDPSSYEDGYAWSLYLQFEDGTVERHKGTGSFAKEITPENYNDFSQKLNDFVEERLKDES